MIVRVQVVLVLATFVFVCNSAFGSSQLGYGNTQCSIFNAIQHEDSAMTQGIDSWALGFLSGLNQAQAKQGKSDRLRTQQPDRVGGYIRAYCTTNTSKTISQAVNSLWSSVNGEMKNE